VESCTLQLEQVGQLSSGKVVIEIENLMEKKSPIWMIHYPPDYIPSYKQFEPFLSGKRLLTTQTFRDLFRSEVVSSSEGIGVQDITFLFTDLKGSTDLYDRIGDLKAYYLVRQHFDTLGRVITQNSGAIVKTIGDAVMATFMNPVDAMKAAIEMLKDIEAFNRGVSQDLILKIGIHRGHSIAVSLNDRLDYFGQTVNIAARVQGLAGASEIYISQDAYDYSGVSGVLAECEVVPEQVSVKGVGEKIQVRKITIQN
jgi:class 3 adenylate cyclase